MKKIIIFILFFISLFLPLKVTASDFSNADNQTNLKSELGKVLSIEYVDLNINNSQEFQVKQVATIELLSGKFKGQKTEIDNILTNNPYYDINLKKGDKVVLHAEQVGKDVEYFIADIQRTPTVAFLAIFFCTLLITVGKKKGFYSVLSIFITLVLIFSVLVPMVLHGISPVFSTILVCIFSTIVTMYMIGGCNAKSTSAIIGTSLSLVFASIFSLFAVQFARLTGFSSEEYVFLYSAHPNLDFIEILIATIMLSALGAVMDIAMTIASTVNELLETNPQMGVKNLIKSGMNVGRDVIGTMANTIILVYLGGALPLVLLSQNIDLQKFFNLNQVATEISAALIGSMSLVVCVPITAFVTAYLVKNAKNNKHLNDSINQSIRTNPIISDIISMNDTNTNKE